MKWCFSGFPYAYFYVLPTPPDSFIFFSDVVKGGVSVSTARHLCESAFTTFSTTALESKAVLCELLQARLHLQLGEHAEALCLCGNALKRLDEFETPILGCQAYFVLGKVREAQQDDQAARRAYERAHARLENLRSHLKAEELKIAFLKDKLAVYESLVWMSLKGRPKRWSGVSRLCRKWPYPPMSDHSICRLLPLAPHPAGCNGSWLWFLP